ncbi:cell division cycle and apoptosis regulator protein 1-like [Trichogramma pretiosum]|uniref:cell division cycle and apoptosis regulator protein 1-like n=1 Tax=Trichogramma pretiosum TaxID=7493 RepID=UPI0006C9B116|nr:cell division cycle and apoptosis regulator protein 1-like [Trichogramma pretiosum]
MSNMSPFGGGKHPPWARNAGQGIQNIPQQMLGQAMNQAMGGQPMVQYQPPNQQVYQQSLNLQQQNINMASMAQLNANMSSGLGGQLYPQVATVSYPTPRTINTNAFPQSVAGVAAAAQQVQQQNVPPSSTKQRVFTGTVTKVHENFGFVDEDVFFQTSACVKGSNPAVGDRVLVEASFSHNMTFKWNATRIQVLPMGNNTSSANSQTTATAARQSQPVRSTGAYSAVPPPSDSSNSRFSTSNSTSSSVNNRNKQSRVRERSPRDRRNDDDEIERKRRREDRIREREKKEERSPSRSRRSKSPRPRRRTRVVPRYMVQIPKISLDLPEADVLEIKRRYQNMYIPSDFFSTNFRWVDAFPPHMPFTLNKPCSFHVMHKDIDPPIENTSILEPPDADYLFSAKVLLISMPQMEEIYKRCCGVTEDRDSDRDYIHPTRLINFLVGLRGKNETMAIGGPWSPSLDGPNPDKDPSVLIKTAIRTCKALTGIDLSNCTQWYRFLELYYRRSESSHHKSGKPLPSRVETVILFLPDVWRCVPTRLEWDSLNGSYRRQLERKLSRGSEPSTTPTSTTIAAVEQQQQQQQQQQDATSTTSENNVENETSLVAVAPAAEQKEEISGDQKEPTHYSQLDPKNMIVNELRSELAARNLNSKGLKSQLQAKLTKALKSEKAKEEGKEESDENDQECPPSPADDGVDEKENEKELEKEIEKEKENEKEMEKEKEKEKEKEYDEDKKKSYEREKALLEKRFNLPEAPHIVVHPSKTAKSGKFDCTVMSLSVLLDYRPEDTKEHSFEVSLFAELFNEMLMRDFGFRIYRSLFSLPEKPKEKEEEKKKDKKDDKKKEDDRKSSKKDDKKDEKKADSCKDKRDDKDTKSKNDDKDKDKNDEEDDDDDDDSDDDDSVRDGRRDKDKDGKKKRVKLYTHDPYLLLSFVYFDQTHCGYIFDKDIEELIYTLGLNLSRAQVRKLVQKVVTRDSLHYRKLTDKVKDDDTKDVKKDDIDNGDTISKIDNEEETLKSLALGNKKLLPVFIGSGPPSKRARGEAGTDDVEMESVPDGFIMFKGSLIDVEKLINQLKRSESARVETEKKMVEIQHELTTLSEKSSKQSSSIKDLSEDLKMYKDRLRGSDDKVKKISTEAYSYQTALKNICHIAGKCLQDNKKVEIVEIKDEKNSNELNGTPNENKSKSDTRWSDNKVTVKREIFDCEKDKKCDNKALGKKELIDDDKDKK